FGETYTPMRPSAVTRLAALLALLPSLTRSSSSARAMSPSASVSAFLHSIMGASAFSRSSLTISAVIAGMLPPGNWDDFKYTSRLDDSAVVPASRCGKKKGHAPPSLLTACRREWLSFLRALRRIRHRRLRRRRQPRLAWLAHDRRGSRRQRRAGTGRWPCPSRRCPG